jgi:hypothetical protein
MSALSTVVGVYGPQPVAGLVMLNGQPYAPITGPGGKVAALAGAPMASAEMTTANGARRLLRNMMRLPPSPDAGRPGTPPVGLTVR